MLSPLVFFQSPSAESRLTLGAMAVTAPVCTDRTRVTVPTPRAAPRANFPSRLLFHSVGGEVLAWLDFQSSDPTREDFLAVTAALMLLRVGIITGEFHALKVCLNLTVSFWNSAWSRCTCNLM